MEKKHKILVADDVIENRKFISILLADMGYSVFGAENGRQALNIFMIEKPDIVILDIGMPEMNGIEVCRIIKSNPETKMIPVMIITALSDEENHLEALEAGADDFLAKPINIYFFKARLKSLLSLKILNDRNKQYQKELKKSNVELLHKLITTQDITIFALAKLAEFRDPETGEHLERMREYVKLITIELKDLSKYKKLITEDYIQNIYKSTPLHDIGKVGIPDNILFKPDKLTSEEFDIMKKHTVIGGDAIRSAINLEGMEKSFLDMGMEIAYFHHERWDGTGYPKGLKGEEIPLVSRITAITDVYDALTSKRVYKPAFSHEKARKIIVEESEGHFDPDVVAAFIELEHNFEGIKNRYKDKTRKMINPVA